MNAIQCNAQTSHHLMNITFISLFNDSSLLQKPHNLHSDIIPHFINQSLLKLFSWMQCKAMLRPVSTQSLQRPALACNQHSIQNPNHQNFKLFCMISQASVGLYGHCRPRSKRVKTSRHLYFKWVLIMINGDDDYDDDDGIWWCKRWLQACYVTLFCEVVKCWMLWNTLCADENNLKIFHHSSLQNYESFQIFKDWKWNDIK